MTKTYKIIENNIEYDIIEYSDNSKYWFYNGRYHRKNGPAIEEKIGSFWYKHGKLHREDGPARIYNNGNNRRIEYWLNNVCYENINSDDEWIIFNLIT